VRDILHSFFSFRKWKSSQGDFSFPSRKVAYFVDFNFKGHVGNILNIDQICATPREYSDGNMMTVVKLENIFHLRNISESIVSIAVLFISLYIKFKNKEYQNDF